MDKIISYQIHPNAHKIAEQIANELMELSKQEEQKTVALSGGSTPKKLFEILAADYAEKINWQKLKFFWVDERCVPHSSPESNYGVAKELLFDKINIPAGNIFPVNGENVPADEAIVYGSTIDKNTKTENGAACFDLVLLGMGTDGHTASIFPHQIELIEAQETCVIGTNPESGQKRVSLSGTVINNAKNVLFMVTGKDKSKLIFEIIKLKNNFESYPASRINPKNGKLLWLLDTEASGSLT